MSGLKNESKGFVYLVGMGPGDPELATVKAIKTIKKCDVLVYDKLVNPFFLGLNPSAKLIFVGKVGGNHTKPQDEINKLLVSLAKDGLTVGRLKGGDPFVFGRGGEEAALLAQNGICFEVVPGVTSAVAVPSSVGIPITQRGIATSFHVITGHEKDGISNIDWKAFAKINGTLCFLMGMEKLGDIRDNLLREGKSPECGAAVIMKGTTGFQRQVFGTLKDIEEKVIENKIKSPAVILIGDVVKIRDKILSPEVKSLDGVRLAVTRASSFEDKLVEGLKEKGALITYIPSIQIMPIEDLDKRLKKINFRNFGGYVFASKEGVDRFFTAYKKAKLDIRSLMGTFYAVGNATAESLADKGITDGVIIGDGKSSDMVDKINAGRPTDYESVAHAIAAPASIVTPVSFQSPQKLLLVTGEKTHGDWDLNIKGWKVSRLIVYKTETGYIHGLEEKVDGIVFMSSSSVKGFFTGGKGTTHTISDEEIKNITAICSGKSSAQTAREFGFKNIVISDKPEVESVIDTINLWNLSRQK